MFYIDNYEPVFPGLSKKSSRALAKLLLQLARISLILGVTFFVIAYAPSLWYATSPERIANVSKLLASTAIIPSQENEVPPQEDPNTDAAPVEPIKVYQPVLDPSLPLENYIKMPSVKIDTQINEAENENYEEALKVGVWRVNDFGTPFARELPTILAAHRYGYLKWSVPYRLKNSFYNLPKLKIGDTVEIVWRQRKYLYEVYAEDRGETINDYSADLILYTCESLNSSIRIIKYARLIEI